MKKIAVAILNWNGKSLLEKYLPSIQKHSGEADIWVIDNASTDDSVSFLEEHYPNLNLLKFSENNGYAGGYNKALKEIPNEWVILANSDIRATPNWLSPLIEEIDNNPNLGAAQPKILADNNPDHFEYAGAAGGFIDKWGYPFCRGRIFDELEEDFGQYNEPTKVFWATGACLLVHKPTFLEVGGLDADFFAHMEEIDLCWRMQRFGKEIKAIPASEVFHLGGGTLSYQSSFKTYLNFRNNLYLLYKNLDKYRLPTLLWRMVLDGISGIRFLFQGNFGLLFAILKAHFHFYLHMGKLTLKRMRVKKLGKPENYEGVYKGSIVWQHFIKKVNKYSALNLNAFTGDANS